MRCGGVVVGGCQAFHVLCGCSQHVERVRLALAPFGAFLGFGFGLWLVVGGRLFCGCAVGVDFCLQFAVFLAAAALVAVDDVVAAQICGIKNCLFFFGM